MDVAVLQLVSRTDTRTRAAVEEIPGNVHAYEPVLGMSAVIDVGYVAPPLIERSRSTLETPTLSEAFHSITWVVFAGYGRAAGRRSRCARSAVTAAFPRCRAQSTPGSPRATAPTRRFENCRQLRPARRALSGRPINSRKRLKRPATPA